MKKSIILFLFSVCLANAQAILPHEKFLENCSDYNFEEIAFINMSDRVLLSGTLIRPNSKFDKIVIIAPGSGKDTRNSHYKLTKSFLENNIAVYRFDDRGVGKSQGIYTNSIDVLSSDLEYCIKNIRKLFKEKSIGILGHSLGGMAAIITTEKLYKPYKIDFLVQMAVPVRNYSDAAKYQLRNVQTSKASTYSENKNFLLFDSLLEIVENSALLDNHTIYRRGLALIKKSNVSMSEIRFWSIYHIELYRKDFEFFYRKLNTPTFYLVGEGDCTVNPNLEIQNLKRYNNSNISYLKLKNLNHYLSEKSSDNSDVYNIDNNATRLMLDWLDEI